MSEEKEIPEKLIPWPANNIQTYTDGVKGEWGFLNFSTFPPTFVDQKPSDEQILERWGARLESQRNMSLK